jgi:hypothetical protein
VTNEFRQMQWDAHLIAGWKRDANTGNVVRMFMGIHGMSLHEVLALKRTPPHGAYFYKPVQAFVARTMPWLSERLWAGDHPADLVLRMDGTMLDAKSPRGRTDRELCDAITENDRTRRVFQHRGHRRSDWHICKG